jgi:hypothetical protein
MLKDFIPFSLGRKLQRKVDRRQRNEKERHNPREFSLFVFCVHYTVKK